jgi:hypothetical protein
VAYRHVVRQRPRNKQLYNGRYYAAARKQQERTGVFCAVRADILQVGPGSHSSGLVGELVRELL